MAIDADKYTGGSNGQASSFDRHDPLNVKTFKSLIGKGTVLPIKILESPREISNDYGDSLVMNVKAKGKTYALFLPAEFVITKQFFQHLGKNTDKWKGKAIRLILVQGRYMNAAK